MHPSVQRDARGLVGGLEAACGPGGPPFGSAALDRELSRAEFGRISQLMRQRYGIDLRPGKESLVSARLGKKLRELGFPSFSAYLSYALADPHRDALIDLVDALTTNHTSFLREQAHFDFLCTRVVPAVPRFASLEIWSAACSSGEEPYSIVCTLLDALKPDGPHFRVLATDLSTRVLKKAQQGWYPEDRFRDVPLSWKQSYLLKGSGERQGFYGFKPGIVKRIEFRRFNLMDSMPSGRRFHVIFCRNVMIYFDHETQRNVVARLTECLEPGGYLFVGHSETLMGIDHKLQYIRPAVYRRRP